MHQLYFVAVPKVTGETIGEAMNKATDLLDNNNFCSSEGGFFSSRKGDWYEVGGRWRDFLCYRHEWAKNAKTEIEAYLKRPENLDGKDMYHIRGAHYGQDETKKKKQAELRERCELIWGKHRPEEYPKVPWDRFYSEKGIFDRSEKYIDDCAEPLSDGVVEYLRTHTKKGKDEFSGFSDVEIFVEDDDGMVEEWLVKDWISQIDEEPRAFIGKYWIVAIDYHM